MVDEASRDRLDGAHPAADSAEAERLREQIRKLVLMKETGPKRAAWHRARVQTIWRLQRQLEQMEQTSPPNPLS